MHYMSSCAIHAQISHQKDLLKNVHAVPENLTSSQENKVFMDIEDFLYLLKEGDEGQETLLRPCLGLAEANISLGKKLES